MKSAMNKLRVYKLIQTGLLFAAAVGVCIAGLIYGSEPEAQLYFQIFFWALLFLSFLCVLIDLKFFAKIDTKSYDLRRTAYVDRLTGVMNRTGMDLLTERIREQGGLPSLGCAAFRLTNLFEVNDWEGHDAGDRLVRRFSALLTAAAGPGGYVCRNNAVTFFVVLPDCGEEKMARLCESVSATVRENNDFSGNPEIRYVSGSVLNLQEKASNPSELFSAAYKRAAGE